MAKTLQAFEHGGITKTHEAFVRGHTPKVCYRYALRDEAYSKGRKIKNGPQRGHDRAQNTDPATVPEPVDRYPEARYSHVQLQPLPVAIGNLDGTQLFHTLSWVMSATERDP